MKDKELIEEKRLWLVKAMADFCRDHLDDEYRELCEKLINKMARKRNVPFLSGKLEIWAAAVVYAIGQINFLFDKSFEPCASADDICDYFNVKKNTVSNKAREIREMFRLREWDEEFSTDKMKESDPLKGTIMVDGHIVPKSSLPPHLRRLFRNL